MKVKKMKFSQDGERDAALPKTITVQLTVKEAIWMTLVAGKQRGEDVHCDIYDCLTTDVFDRFWEDGVEEASREYPVTIPPIVYRDKKSEEKNE